MPVHQIKSSTASSFANEISPGLILFVSNTVRHDEFGNETVREVQKKTALSIRQIVYIGSSNLFLFLPYLLLSRHTCEGGYPFLFIAT